MWRNEMNPFLFSVSCGLGVYNVQLAQGLAMQKEKVAIALDARDACGLRASFPSFFQEAGFKTISFPHYGGPDPRKLVQIFRCSREIMLHRTDVVHVTPELLTESLPVLWFAYKSGLPLVATVHDPWFHPGDLPALHTAWLNFTALDWCSQIIVHGEKLAAELTDRLGMDERLMNVIPHGNYDIYRHACRPSDLPDSRPGQVLMFGRMKKYKGLDVLLDAAPMVADKVPDLKIILAGRGDELKRLRNRFEAYPCFEILDGWIPGEDVPTLFSSSALLVMPYTEASQSGVLHLAYTFGRPVVATHVGAIPEGMTHDKEGYLVPPGDAGKLADAMIGVLVNRDLADRFGRAARMKAVTELNWAGEIASKTRLVYEKAKALRKKNIWYPGIGARARWQRVKEDYCRQRLHEQR